MSIVKLINVKYVNEKLILKLLNFQVELHVLYMLVQEVSLSYVKRIQIYYINLIFFVMNI